MKDNGARMTNADSNLEESNHFSIIKFKDSKIRGRYSNLVNGILNSQKYATVTTSVLTSYHIYKTTGQEVPIDLQVKYDELVSRLPMLEGVHDPVDIADRFRESVLSSIFAIANIMVDGAKDDEVVIQSIHNLLAPIVFSEEDIDMSDSELEELIDEVVNIKVKDIALA